MSELNILAAALQKKEVLVAIDACLDVKEDFTSQAQLVLKGIREWYETDPEFNGKVDRELLRGAVTRSNPRHAEKLGIFVDRLFSQEVSPDNIQSSILGVKRAKVMHDLGSKMLNNPPYETLIPELQQLEALHGDDFEERSLSTHEYEVYNGVDFESLLTRAVNEDKVPIYPPVVNAHLRGGVWRQASIVVYGRPDIGKTTFMVNLSCGFLSNGFKVLYLANEDPASQLLIRHIQCFLGKDKEWVEQNFREHQEACERKGLTNLYLCETPAGTIRNLEEIIKDKKPDVVIVDQLRNMLSDQDQRVMQLEDVQRRIRQLGKKHNCITVSTTQAGASGNNKAVLDMGDVDFSKTGIPGACDLMMGIGCTPDMELIGQRMMSFPKNKISGTKEPIPVTFRCDICRVE